MAAEVQALKADKQGNAKAQNAANQVATANFAAQGKTPSPQDIQRETIKTLGEAKKEMKQEEWDKIVDGTEGGKLAKNILEQIPKVKTDQFASSNNAMEYSI